MKEIVQKLAEEKGLDVIVDEQSTCSSSPRWI
jgi:Skp family chaperone for outer membrane proteins